MSDIKLEDYEPIKLAALNNRELIVKIRSLITTIESQKEDIQAKRTETERLFEYIRSQKEEIEKLQKERNRFEQKFLMKSEECQNNIVTIETLKGRMKRLAETSVDVTEIKSLKTITELAVKALRDVVEYDIEIGCYTSTAINAIKEIERLSK